MTNCNTSCGTGKRPSVINATSLPKPRPTIEEVGANISGIPGPPFGPSYLMTTTWPARTVRLSIASTASSCELKQIAFPVNVLIDGSTPPTLITAPFGAILPNKIDKPPCASYGASRG